ncbi:MAG: STM3941 family protein, partial [Chitinophagaceae bacterium]
HFYNKPIKVLPYIAISLAFVSIGIWLLLTSNEISNFYVGLATLIFFGFCLGVSIYVFVDKKPQIILSEKGIWHKQVKLTLLHWENIQNVATIHVFAQPFIAIKVDESIATAVKQPKWINKLNLALGAETINLSVSSLTAEPKEIVFLVNQLRTVTDVERINIIKQYLNQKR